MKQFLFFILTFICTAILAQNYSLSQIALDLNEHKKPVYFCFTKDTYNPNFAENDLKTFQSNIKEFLKYNFIFHLENHNKKWEDLANTQHGVQYTIVCDLGMRFGVEGIMTLYYQNPIRDLQWEQVASVNYSTKEEKEWIKNLSFHLSEKLKSIDDGKPDLFTQELEKRDRKIQDLLVALKLQVKKLEEENHQIKEQLKEHEKQIKNAESLIKVTYITGSGKSKIDNSSGELENRKFTFYKKQENSILRVTYCDNIGVEKGSASWQIYIDSKLVFQSRLLDSSETRRPSTIVAYIDKILKTGKHTIAIVVDNKVMTHTGWSSDFTLQVEEIARHKVEPGQ